MGGAASRAPPADDQQRHGGARDHAGEQEQGLDHRGVHSRFERSATIRTSTPGSARTQPVGQRLREAPQSPRRGAGVPIST